MCGHLLRVAGERDEPADDHDSRSYALDDLHERADEILVGHPPTLAELTTRGTEMGTRSAGQVRRHHGDVPCASDLRGEQLQCDVVGVTELQDVPGAYVLDATVRDIALVEHRRGRVQIRA